jgi:DNA-directed RNA polymerase subunit RPC12/RpoP
MSLLTFIEKFPDEASCRKKFKEYRDKEGIVCKQCGHTRHYWLQGKEQYQCKQCGFRTTLRSGTVMQASKLPFRYWFIAMHLLTSTKKTFSALEFQRQIGHKSYEPIWYMLQKLRSAMGQRDSQYRLDKIVELDEGFFSSVDKENKYKDKQVKRGRGSQKKSKILVMASTSYDFNTTKKHNKPKRFRYIRMVVIDDLKSETIGQAVEKNLSFDSVLKTDNYPSYSSLQQHVWSHKPQTLTGKESLKALPWVHTMISNVKRTLLGIHHMVSKKHIQKYLDEFCYKTNRRYFGDALFERLLIASVSNKYVFSGN